MDRTGFLMQEDAGLSLADPADTGEFAIDSISNNMPRTHFTVQMTTVSTANINKHNSVVY
jgi:hypothetical protein